MRILIADDAPRLAILDWEMPGRDGVSICRELRRREDGPYVYVILLTARSALEHLVEAMDAGADDFLSKPFEAIGIDPRYHETVFGLFDRLDHDIEGTGIGLALVRRIVEVHGGRIWVESEGEGKGSTFWFTLAEAGGQQRGDSSG